MNSIYSSGSATSAARSDCFIRYSPAPDGDLNVVVNSKVASLYGEDIHRRAVATLAELGIHAGRLEIDDGGAVPFVIQARIEAAVRSAHPDLTARALPEIKAHAQTASAPQRFRRSRIYVPGVQPKLMLNVGIHRPDVVILDLEDSVAPPEKLSARLIVRNALRVLDFFGAERAVRVNQGAAGLADLAEIVPQPVNLILLPKVESTGDIEAAEKAVQAAIHSSKRTAPLYFMPIIESAKGIINAPAIAAASERNVALAIGLEDFTADLGVERTREGRESFYARSAIIIAARSAGLQAIATVFSDLQDETGLRASAAEAKALGFDGMGAIHPGQIRPIHEAFAPSEAEIEKAKKIVHAFQIAEDQGLGVVSLGSKMIDPPVVKRAQRTIDLAVAAGLLPGDWKP